jgi:hypothetical protein
LTNTFRTNSNVPAKYFSQTKGEHHGKEKKKGGAQKDDEKTPEAQDPKISAYGRRPRANEACLHRQQTGA